MKLSRNIRFRKFKNFFIYDLHQLPQNIIGYILSRGYVYKEETDQDKNVFVYYKYFNNKKITMGKYIIMDYSYCDDKYELLYLDHEYGHSVQSKYLGWLYLLLIQLPVLLKLLYMKFILSHWQTQNKYEWYFRTYPEAWADHLGGVNR